MFENDPRLEAYFWIQFIGGVLLTMLIASHLCSSAGEGAPNSVLMSFYLSFWWIPFPGMMLLFYAGQAEGPPPSPGVCVASYIFSTIVTPITASASFSLTFSVWYSILCATRPANRLVWECPHRKIILSLLPCVVGVVWSLALLIVGLKNRDHIARAVLYCTIDESQTLVAASVFSLIFIIPTFALASRIMYLLFRARVRGSFHNLFDVPYIARAVVFIAYLFIGMVFIAEGISKWTNVSSDIFVSTFPLAVSVIFGYRQATNALRTHVFYRLLNHDSNGDRHPYPFGQSSNFRPRLSRMVTPDVTNFGVADPEATAWHDIDLSTDKRSQGCQYGSDFLQSPPETARNSVEDDPQLDLPVRPKLLHLPTQEGDSERDVGPWDIGSIQSRRAHAVYRRGSELDGMDMSDILFESERDPILEGHRR